MNVKYKELSVYLPKSIRFEWFSHFFIVISSLSIDYIGTIWIRDEVERDFEVFFVDGCKRLCVVEIRSMKQLLSCFGSDFEKTVISLSPCFDLGCSIWLNYCVPARRGKCKYETVGCVLQIESNSNQNIPLTLLLFLS